MATYYVTIDANFRITTVFGNANPSATHTLELDVNPVRGDYYVNDVHILNPGRYQAEIALLWTYDYLVEEWTVDQEAFDVILRRELSEYRWEKTQDLVAEVVGDTYVKDNNGDFILDETGKTLEFGVDNGTEASLITKVVTASGMEDPAPIQRYKFINANVFVARETLAEALGILDNTRQPHFDAEGHVLDVHSVTPFLTIPDAKDAYDNYLGGL